MEPLSCELAGSGPPQPRLLDWWRLMVDNDLDALEATAKKLAEAGRTTSSTSRPAQLAPCHDQAIGFATTAIFFAIGRPLMNAADDPATARSANWSPARRQASEPEGGVARHRRPWVTAARRRLPVMIGYVIAIANGSADSQDVSSCAGPSPPPAGSAGRVDLRDGLWRRSPAPPTDRR